MKLKIALWSCPAGSDSVDLNLMIMTVICHNTIINFMLLLTSASFTDWHNEHIACLRKNFVLIFLGRRSENFETLDDGD